MSKSQEKVPISILVPIKNEADNLPRCLSSVSWADQIFVVDSQSIDGSQAIAESFGATVVQFEFNGTWPKKKNWSLENLAFKYEWVFILDADEVLPSSAAAEIKAIVTKPAAESDPVGYWVNRHFYFLGKRLNHCYYPNWNLRLFKHKLGRYEKLTEIDTASGDNEVHEHVMVNGKTAKLKSELDHFAFPSVEVFIEKHNRYSNWEARVWLEQSKSTTAVALQTGTARDARLLRRVSQSLPFRPLLRFLYVYIFQMGFLDGIEGFYFARLHALYEFLIVAKTHELKMQRARLQNGR
jgi:glycosyltransferase involved in cell wall biosynthesis